MFDKFNSTDGWVIILQKKCRLEFIRIICFFPLNTYYTYHTY